MILVEIKLIKVKGVFSEREWKDGEVEGGERGRGGGRVMKYFYYINIIIIYDKFNYTFIDQMSLKWQWNIYIICLMYLMVSVFFVHNSIN